MALFKHFALKENMAFEFRAEAFNIFNHTEFEGPGSTAGAGGGTAGVTCTGGTNNSAGDPSCLGPGGANLFEISSAHVGRILQFGLKFLF